MPATDAVIDSLVPLLDRNDIIIDGGNSKWTDTIRREKELKRQGSPLHRLGGLRRRGRRPLRPVRHARRRPGRLKHLKPIWNAIAAKVDPKTGREIEGATPGKPITGGAPCAAYIGPNGAGHYVKMVHNGIEYGDMQMICEAYDLMQELLGMTAPEMGKVFGKWNEGSPRFLPDRDHRRHPPAERPGNRQTVRRHRARHRRPERHRQVDLHQRPRHGHARPHHRRGRLRPLRLAR